MPKLEKITINYSASIKASLPHDRFENTTAGEVVEETWDVSDMSNEEALLFQAERRAVIKELVDTSVQDEYGKIKGVE